MGAVLTFTYPKQHEGKICPELHRWRTGESVQVLTCAITAHTDGVAAASTTVSIIGRIARFAVVDNGTNPTADWDFTLKDTAGADVLAGAGTDMASAADSAVIADGGVPVHGLLTLTCAAMGSGGQALLTIYLVP